jgi:hypothetical protein
MPYGSDGALCASAVAPAGGGTSTVHAVLPGDAASRGPPAPACPGTSPAPAPTAAAAATVPPPTLQQLPFEVLCIIATALPDARDRAALGATFNAARGAAAATAVGLLLPGELFASGHPGAAPRIAAALSRYPAVTRLAVAPVLRVHAAVPASTGRPGGRGAPALGGCAQAAAALISGLPGLHRLARLDLSGAPAAVYERLPAPLLAALVAACPHLVALDISALLWHAPAQSAVLRAMAQYPAPPPPGAASPPATLPPPACPAAAPAAAAVPVQRWVADGPWADLAAVAADAAAATAAAASAAAAAAATAAAHQGRLQMMAALLARALLAQAAREDLRALSALTRLTSLTVSEALPPEALLQLPGLPPGLRRLGLDCSLLCDDAALGRTLAELSGLSALTLVRLPSLDGSVFSHMAGAPWLP